VLGAGSVRTEIPTIRIPHPDSRRNITPSS
jgi:hypothetical protein